MQISLEWWFTTFNCQRNNLRLFVHNKDRLGQFIEEGFTLNQYIIKMLLKCEWGSHSEIAFFSEIYNVQIQVFDSILSQDPKARLSTRERILTLILLYSDDDHCWLLPKIERDTAPYFDHKVKKGLQ